MRDTFKQLPAQKEEEAGEEQQLQQQLEEKAQQKGELEGRDSKGKLQAGELQGRARARQVALRHAAVRNGTEGLRRQPPARVCRRFTD